MDPKPYPDALGLDCAGVFFQSLSDPMFASLVRWILQYEPTARSEAQDVVDPPWFDDFRVKKEAQ